MKAIIFELHGANRDYILRACKVAAAKASRAEHMYVEVNKEKFHVELGYESPVIVVRQYVDGLCALRPYETYPEIYINQAGEEQYQVYMKAPIGHDGQFFTPADAVRVQDKRKQADLLSRWHAPKGAQDPVLSKAQFGIERPARYRYRRDTQLTGSCLSHGACFLVEHNSHAAQILQRFKQENPQTRRIQDYFRHARARNVRLESLGNADFIIYSLGGVTPKIMAVPEGLTRVPLNDVNWLLESQADLLMGIYPPPMPAEAAYLQRVQESMMSQAFQAHRTRPQKTVPPAPSGGEPV